VNTVPVLANVQNCVFTSNMAQSFGGAMYVVNQRIQALDCAFNQNIGVFRLR
jgi:predicted outer membrane repeat protein